MLKLLFWGAVIYLGYSFFIKKNELKAGATNPELPEEEFVDYEEIEE